jgi:HEPN domain-containing protein
LDAIAARSVLFRKTHDLPAILALAPADVAVRLAIPDLEILSEYAVDVRYPDAPRPLTLARAEEAVAIAKKVRDEVRRHLPARALEGL